LFAPAQATHVLSAGESAWLAALPCALLLLLAIVALGPPLGSLLFPATPDGVFWSMYLRAGVVRPEPTEHARYLIALAGPLLLSGATLGLAGRRVTSAALPLAVVARAALVAFATIAVVAQERHVYERLFTQARPHKAVYFTLPTLIAAAVLALLATAVLQRPRLVTRLGAAIHETRVKQVAAGVAASVFVAAWLLTGFNTDSSLTNVNVSVAVNIPFWIDEAFSILNGQAPLVDFNAQYGHLWAYIAAGGLALLGSSFVVYASVMLAGTAACLAAVYATFRRLLGSSVATLGLFLPFVATSFFMEEGPLHNRYGPANLFSIFPIRYAGPFLLLWLVVRRIGRPSERAPVLLFAVAGLVLLNNLEFGVPALGATIAALLWSSPPRSLGRIGRLAGAAAAGIACAVAIVCVLTLLVAGSLPHFEMLLTFPRIYGTGSFGLLPMPALGLHLAVYMTFAAAIVAATVRATSGNGAADPALTGALAWSGVFGLGAGAYFVGRSHPLVLIDLFSAWSLAITLLLIAIVPAILRRPSRRPELAEALVLIAFAATVCSLAQTPLPWTQIQRLRDVVPVDTRYETAVVAAVRTLTHPRETVAHLKKQGHRIADELGLVDVTPYANIESMMTRRQWAETIAALRRAHGRKIILVRETLFNEEILYVEHSGFKPTREAHGLRLIEFVARHPGGGPTRRSARP
jgi:hypothetical protein